MKDKIILSNNRIINYEIKEELILINIKKSKFVDCILSFELIDNDLMNYIYFSIEIKEKYITFFHGGYFLDDESNISNNISQDELEIFEFKKISKSVDYKNNLSLILNKNEVQIKINSKTLILTDLLKNYKKNIYIFREINKEMMYVDSYMEVKGLCSPQDLLFENKES